MKYSRHKKPWTPKENKILLAEWQACTVRTLRQKLRGRSERAIRYHAVEELGLPVKIGGAVTVMELCERLGYTLLLMRKLLRWGGVHPQYLPRQANFRTRRKSNYDFDEAREVVERWESLEKIDQAAVRLRMCRRKLVQLLREQGVEPPGFGLHERHPRHVYDEVVGAHRAWLKENGYWRRPSVRL